METMKLWEDANDMDLKRKARYKHLYTYTMSSSRVYLKTAKSLGLCTMSWLPLISMFSQQAHSSPVLVWEASQLEDSIVTGLFTASPGQQGLALCGI